MKNLGFTVCAIFAMVNSLAAQESPAVNELPARESQPLTIQPAEPLPESSTAGNDLVPIEAIPAQPTPGIATSTSSEPAVQSPGLTTYQLFQTPKTEYRYSESISSIVPSSSDSFGWFSFDPSPYHTTHLINDERTAVAITGDIGIHFLRGPTTTPIPPRLFDFIIGMQVRDSVNDTFSYDVATSIGAYGDFEDSVRDGVRLASHAVGFLNLGTVDAVFGVDYLDRQDIKLLPVGGLVFRHTDFRAELVFPRPRVDIAIDEHNSLFFKGNLGGGSWDIERPDESDDVFTYRAYEFTVGIQSIDEDDEGCPGISSIEFGYVFDRQLSFRNTNFEQDFDDAFMIRFVRYE